MHGSSKLIKEVENYEKSNKETLEACKELNALVNNIKKDD